MRTLFWLRLPAAVRAGIVVLFLFGQAALLAHGAEHLGGGEVPHVCAVCLAGQGVDTPGPAAAAPLVPASVGAFARPPEPVACGVSAFPFRHPARGPPAA